MEKTEGKKIWRYCPFNWASNIFLFTVEENHVLWTFTLGTSVHIHEEHANDIQVNSIHAHAV
jgi:hypothetical protein